MSSDRTGGKGIGTEASSLVHPGRRLRGIAAAWLRGAKAARRDGRALGCCHSSSPRGALVPGQWVRPERRPRHLHLPSDAPFAPRSRDGDGRRRNWCPPRGFSGNTEATTPRGAWCAMTGVPTLGRLASRPFAGGRRSTSCFSIHRRCWGRPHRPSRPTSIPPLPPLVVGRTNRPRVLSIVADHTSHPPPRANRLPPAAFSTQPLNVSTRFARCGPTAPSAHLRPEEEHPRLHEAQISAACDAGSRL